MNKKSILATITACILVFISILGILPKTTVKASNVVDVESYNLDWSLQKEENTKLNNGLNKAMDEIKSIVKKQQELEARVVALENKPAQIIKETPISTMKEEPKTYPFYEQGSALILSKGARKMPQDNRTPDIILFSYKGRNVSFHLNSNRWTVNFDVYSTMADFEARINSL